MQNLEANFKIIFTTFILCLLGCQKNNQEDFSTAISRSRNTIIDQVNTVKDGAPYFVMDTLNPIWDIEQTKNAIVSIPKFELIDQKNNKVTDSLFENKISIVAFVFTSCQGICPVLVQQVKKSAKTVQNLKNVQFVLFTVDPEVDTPKVLTNFATTHGLTNWTLLTGNKDVIYSIAKKTFASQVFKKENSDFRNFAHTEHFYLVDEHKYLRGIFNGTRIDTPNELYKAVQSIQKK